MTNTDGTQTLSPQQQKVYDLHKEGHTNAKIAEALGIKPGTVSNLKMTALRKLGEVSSNGSGTTDPVTHAMQMVDQIDEEIVTHLDHIDTLRKQRTQWGVILDTLRGDDDTDEGDDDDADGEDES